MSPLRRLVAFLLLSLAGPALALDPPLQVTKNVWFIQGVAGVPSVVNRGHTSNAGFVVTSEGVVVFDALGTPVLGQELVDAIRKVTSAPIRRVILSHYHADHFYGLPALKKAGAEVWAHRSARGHVDSEAARLRLAERRQSLAPWVGADMQLVPADRWIEGETSFRLGGITFRLFPVGPAHTPEDLAMSVEEEQVLFVGDLMFAGRIPFVGDADSKAWIAAIDRVIRGKPKIMIGGHGGVSMNASADLAMTREYLLYLREKMGKAAEDLEDFDAAYAATDWSKFAGLPAFAEANRRNAYNVYLQMQAGGK